MYEDQIVKASANVLTVLPHSQNLQGLISIHDIPIDISLPNWVQNM